MKSRHIKLTALIFLNAAVFSSFSHAQAYGFEVPGFDPATGYINEGYVPGLGATGTVTFSGDQLTVDITNGDGTNDSDSISSHLSKIFILMPVVDGTRVDIDSFDSGPSGWSLSNDLDTPSNNGKPGTILGIGQTADYGGVVADNAGSRMDQGDREIFSFTLSADTTGVTWSDYLGENRFASKDDSGFIPHIVLRFQSIDPAVAPGQDSAAGYGEFIDIPIIPVPEPSQIAALSMAGLAGLLLVRRRIKAKRAKRT